MLPSSFQSSLLLLTLIAASPGKKNLGDLSQPLAKTKIMD